ncbi:MAG: peptidase S41 [Rhodospirillaceae bacterium]|nr:peptidase S41 [Rhodospirillaceae bacterium]
MIRMGARFPAIRLNRGLVAVSAALLLVACAGTPTPQATTDKDSGFSMPAAAEVIAAGYENIAEKYLEPMPIREIGTEGLRGLGAIDPAIAIEIGKEEVRLTDNGQEIAREALPKDGDAYGWALLTARASQAARGWSEEMRRASPEKIYEAVFDGMLTELDIYSRYSGREEAQRNRARRDGFGGIGVRFRQKGDVTEVYRITPGTPAAKADLKVGDVIVSADGVALKGLPARQIVKLLRGPIDTSVRLRLKRESRPEGWSLNLVRRHIVPVTVSHTVKDGIIYAAVASFNQKTADSVKKAILTAKAEAKVPLKGMVMDLRGNPGGLLRQSVKLANLFLTQGHIITTRGRHPDSVHHYNADGHDILNGLPLVILIDGKSASAAEITAAALQDRGRAVVVGTSSYGKGSVQTVIRLPNDGELTITWSKLITPTGYTLHGLGVHPIVCTSSSAEIPTDSETRDPVLSGIGNEPYQADVLARWRRGGPLDEEERTRLRDTCPPERHDDAKDRDVARRIIEDRALYARALTYTSTTARADAAALE